MQRSPCLRRLGKIPTFWKFLTLRISATQETSVVATCAATDLSKAGGKVLDDAATGAVRIWRRGTSYMLMREDQFSRLLAGVREGRPQSPEDCCAATMPRRSSR
jgi:hypothetical protein